MKQKSLLIAFLLTLVLFAGCTNTRHMLSPFVLDPAVPLETKLAYYGLPEVQITYPDVYYNGNEWKDRLIELVQNAEEYLITSAFLASSAKELEELYETLAMKAESGVKVYFVVDGIGPFDMTETRLHLIPIKFLTESGVHLLEYNPISGGRIVSGANLLLRDHRKFLIVDGKYLAIGGMNLNYISIGATDDNLQRDSMYEFFSPELCEVLLDNFVPWWNTQSWEEIRREDFSVDHSTTDGKQTYRAWYMDQFPLDKKASGVYGSLLAEAQHSVKVLPFLPFLDKHMIEAFRLAQERGVDIQMVIPFDKRVGNRKGIEYMTKDLLKMGIDLRIEEGNEEQQALLHEKLMIVDDRYVVIGSTNLNYRSFNLAYETALIIDSEKLARQVTEHFQKIYAATIPVTEEMAKTWRTFARFPRFLFAFIGG